MGSVNPLRNKRNCLYGIATKHSIFDRIPQFFRKYEKIITCSPCTSIYQRIYNVQYTYYATHTHSVFDFKSRIHRISDRILFSNKLGWQYYSSVSELANSESAASPSDSIDNSSNKSLESSKIAIPLCYEDYWSDEQIREIESSRPDLLVRGTVFVPAFNTSESRLISADSEHACSIARKTDSEDGVRRRESNELKIYGFISRNRAFHGDNVVCIKSRRHKGKSPQDNLKETPGECRVISIINRNPKLHGFVATFNVAEFYDDALRHIRCQPRDTRWPAFKVDKSSLKSEIAQRLSSMKSDQKTLCMCRFLHWHEHQLEPTGAITSLLGDVGETNSQMEATMLFHGLDASDFSESVLEDLGELIKRGNETRDLNRVDMNHLFVLSIDPQDAKDLDDALSVEKLLDDKGNVYYRIGIHIADVSHYVKEDSLVDLDARSRATSVYLEHKVYPMLPRQLSEDLCSLLPNRERLCFSVFVEVVECGDGEKIGNDLYIKDVQFKLTKITSKNRLGYDNAKTMLASCLKMKKADSNLTGCTFASIESLISQLDLQDETKVALVRLYCLAQKLRFYRLKQLGAVHVDIDGSIKCHIPKIDMELPRRRRPAPNRAVDADRSDSVDDAVGEVAKRPREEQDQQGDQDLVYEMYLNKKRKLDRNYLLRIEKIPKESHELIEEMMLLANTQVAKFLSEKIDLYLLRVHEDTSKDVRSFIEEVLPSNLRHLIHSSSLNVTQVLSKCEEYMDPAAFQSLSFSVLQKFKEAFYSPINKNNSSPKDSISGNGNGKNSNLAGTFWNGNGGSSKQSNGTNYVDDHTPESVSGVYGKGFSHQFRRDDYANDGGREVDYAQNDTSNGLYQSEHIDDYVEDFKKEYRADQYKGHWGLALPVYLHFTSPIRRYPDLYTHRMLKNILHEEGKTTSVELLSKICERCNVQKRRAFDAQKEYKNFAFNRYLQFISFIATKIDPTYLKTVSIARAYPSDSGGFGNVINDSVVASDLGDKREVWGYLYGDACISSIVSTPVATVNSNKANGEAASIENGQAIGKTCLVFYIPLLNEQKSISCESLGLVPINIHFQKTKRQKQKVKNSMLDSYYKSRLGGPSHSKDVERAKEDQEAKIQGLSAMMRDKRMEFYIYQKVRVLLVPGLKMWTVRFPEIT